jgi:hypothetical protein
MRLAEQWRALGKVPAVRTALFVLGCLLLLVTPFVGVLPGPGGIITFGAGAALVLKYSAWAKRRYARFRRRHPMKAAWTDWSLRRRSARRREERRKRAEAKRAAEEACRRELARLERPDGEAKLVLVRHDVGIGYFIERRFAPEGPFEHESYWAAVRFSALHADFEAARAEGLDELERV